MTHRGIEITGEAGNRRLEYDGTVLAYGGDGTDGLVAVGTDLMLDGKVICSSSIPAKLGIIEKDGDIMFGDAVIGVGYPKGLSPIGCRTARGPYVRYPDGWPSTNGIPQGAAIYQGRWYQFYNGGHVSVHDLLTGNEVSSFNIPYELWPNNEALHCSSAIFSGEFENEGEELPLCYITTNGYTFVINLNGNIHLVRWWYIDNNVNGDTTLPAHAAVGTFDFAHGIGYSIGYPQGVGTGSTNHAAAGKFEIIPYTFPESGSGDCSSSVVLDVSNKIILEKDVNVTYVNEMTEGHDRDWSNMQDADFKNGHLYILYGGTNGREDSPKIIDYIPAQESANAMFTHIVRDDNGLGVEGEGMACFSNGWVVTGPYTSDKMFVL